MRRLQVRVVPTTATVTVDGAAAPSPYDARLPLGRTYTVVVSADGYQSLTHRVLLDRDRDVTLRLERVPAARAAEERAEPRPRARPERRRRARPASSIRREESRPREPAASPPASSGSSSSGHGGGFVAENPY
jgi:hypothetical protein